MKHATTTTLEPVMVPGGYVSPEKRDGYIVWEGFTLHKNDTTEYVGAGSSRREVSNAVYDTYRKGPLSN